MRTVEIHLVAEMGEADARDLVRGLATKVHLPQATVSGEAVVLDDLPLPKHMQEAAGGAEATEEAAVAAAAAEE